ncbi:MAG: serine/threonine protein phosphatase [Clostridiales bacterium]|nr:serine/threonine protein phosphatase [Clostridiales bacterium]
MKIFAISDLHLSVNNSKPMDIFGPVWEGYLDKIFSQWQEKVTEEDIVLMAGDLSWAMKMEEVKSDIKLFENLKGKKVIIRGNHDYWWHSISALRAILPENFYAIQNDAIRFDGVVLCGTRGWKGVERNQVLSPEDQKIFDREVLRLEMTLQNAKKLMQEGDKLICMMHYPPLGMCKDDTKFSLLIEEYGVDIVVYGHLHGYKNPDIHFEKNGVEYFLTSCDEINNELIEICDIKGIV